MTGKVRICVVVPTFDNAGTVADVVKGVLEVFPDVIVVNDGSTDDTLQRLEGLDVTLVSYGRNKGKGGALREGFRKALEMGFTHAVTIDSDGQHFPSDIPAFIAAVQENPDALFVGRRDLDAENMPQGNSFANRFSNFWFRLQTGIALEDTQTGFRAYPLQRLPSLRFLTSRYESELELLVFSAWRGVPLRSLKIRVWYPPKGERVTHFRPFADFFRISVLNTVLCVLALVYGWPRMLFHRIFRKPGDAR